MIIQRSRMVTLGMFLLLEVALFVLLFVVIPDVFVSGGVGENVTVTTTLQVGNVYPEILNVSVDAGASSITLVANSTKLVSCVAVVRDYNNDTDISAGTARFFDTVVSSYGDGDDNNYHYTNTSCTINTSFVAYGPYTDDDYLALVNCTFPVAYYANAQSWNCTFFVNDSFGWSDTDSDLITVDELLAVGLPSTINYGTVNATYVSDENVTNVTNLGNVALNLSLSGYGVTEGDGLAMNCTLGSVGNISVYYEKYNVTMSTPGALSLSSFEANYTNLTSSPVINDFALAYRQNDGAQGVDDTNATYWRIYVPLGVAGTCSGTILFGATTANV